MARKERNSPHSICVHCDVGFIKKDGSCAICGDAEGVYRCSGAGRCAWCDNDWPRWEEEQK